MEKEGGMDGGRRRDGWREGGGREGRGEEEGWMEEERGMDGGREEEGKEGERRTIHYAVQRQHLNFQCHTRPTDGDMESEAKRTSLPHS